MNTDDYDLYGGTPPHVGGSDTSKRAAESVKASAKTLRRKIHQLLKRKGDRGATCWEIEQEMGMMHQSASARLRELVIEGNAIDSGYRRKTGSGRNAVVVVAADLPGFERGPHKSAKQRIQELETENASLRRRLRQAGLL